MAVLTLLDIAKMNGSDAVAGLIDEVARAHPELTGVVKFMGQDRVIPNVGASRTIKGQQYRTLVRTAAPTVGFRNANEGVAPTKSTYENRLVETFIMNPRWTADKAVADAHEDGWASVMALEAGSHMEASMHALATQFYYGRGTGGDAKGHPGLIDSVDSTLVVDAGGTTASTGSSVYAVKFGMQDVIWVWGQNGDLKLSDLDERNVTDSGGTNQYTAYFQELHAYAGVQVGNKNCIGRIKKLTEDSGKGLTDARVMTLLALFPTGSRPDVLFMSRRSLRQLQASRTATSPTGAPAPFPTEVEGVPIAVTDALSDTEALTL